MRVYRLVLCVLLGLVLLLGASALMAQDGVSEGEAVDAFLVLALPAIMLIVYGVTQFLKAVFPETMVTTETLTRIVKGVFVIAFVGAGLLGLDEQLGVFVGFLNQLSDPLMALIALIVGWIGPSALYEWFKARRVPVLGDKQGDGILSLESARASPHEDWRAAA